MNRHLDTLLNLYPPYLGAGIRVDEMSDDRRYVRMKMPLTFYNQNYVGTQFGGSLYSMCDPIYMLMLMENLGSSYIVWDKSAEIEFKSPGEGTVYAEFELDDPDLDRIRREAADNYKTEPTFDVEVEDETGDTIAIVHKRLYVREK